MYKELAVTADWQNMQKGLWVVKIFYSTYLLFVLLSDGMWGTNNIILFAAVVILLAIFMATGTLIGRSNKVGFWDLINLFSCYMALNLVVYLSGGYSSSYHFLYLVPIGIFSLSGKHLLGMLMVHLNSAALLYFVLMEAIEHTIVLSGIFFHIVGIIILMYMEFRVITVLMRQVEVRFKEMQNVARYDDQTRLLRYGEFKQVLLNSMERWHHDEQPFVLAVVDLGNLKYYNSRYGYNTGDKIIVQMAEVLKQLLSDQDYGFRYAGDQFAIITTSDEQQVWNLLNQFRVYAVRVAEKLAIAELNILVGVADCPGDADSGDRLLEKAMNRLEEAKAQIKKNNQARQNRAEKMALVGHLAAGLAHELRNPLTSVKGFCQLARERSSETEVQQYLQAAGTDLDKLIRLIGDFLLLTKPAAPQLEPIDVISLCQEVIDFLESQARLHEISVIMQIPSYFPSVNGDREQLRKAFINVIVNAFEAMNPNGQLTIRLDTVGDKVAVAFEDDGKGIANQDITHILNPFFTTKEEGTGLGLAITQRIVVGHGGDIVVRSQTGEGTVVTLYLPAANEQELRVGK